MNKINIISHKNLNFLKSEDFVKVSKNQDFTYDELFIDYLKLYNSNSKYQNISFELNDSKNVLFCPLTIETKNVQKSLNFYGTPFVISHNQTYKNIFYKYIFEFFLELIDKNVITNFMLKKYINETEINKYLENDSDNIEAIYSENLINLHLSLNDIFSGFTKGHKSSLKKEYPELKYEIFDHTNYKEKQILEMMELHYKVSNKVTRSEKSWLLNEKMIINRQGFLIRIMNNDQLISYSFFFHNKFNAAYSSSCSIRETFGLFKNLTHKTIWKGIEYLKKIKCSYLTLDPSRTLYNSNKINLKEKNIQRFKASFGGIRQNYIVYKKMPKEI